MAATYFHGNTEMQGNGDALQTLILMNPAYVGYSDNQHHLPPPPPPTNFIFLNNSSSSATATQIHHFSGIPLQASPQHQDVSDLHGGSSPRFHYNLYNPQINGGAAREVTRAKQGLSLSLSSQQPARPAPETAAEVRVFGGVPNNVVLSCKYLKVAQQLLDEVVNIEKEAKNGRVLSKEDNGNPKNNAEAATAGDSGAKGGAELTTAEKQEIQMKKAKLVDMLDEVEQRYKQYEQQMQMVIRWFEEAGGGGVGSAKTYTALALQTISKQFRSLKDAIMAQIGAATRNLGEEENFGRKLMEGSRLKLKYIDNEIRQQQQQQQFGMIQNSAWRPQRGLPERSVSVLRAWLFQHFLHPYPKDTDKIMLAKQAGLTRSQVSNWFINARVRLWKPMVEEMYAEEIKGQQRSGSSTEKSSSDQVKQASTTKSQEINNVGLFNLIETQQGRKSPKKPRNTTITPPDVSMRSFGYDDERLLQSREGFTISGGGGGAPPQPAANFFGTYPLIMGSVEQFQPPYSSNGVSLTLGLQHSNQNRSSSVENDFGTLNVHDTTSSAVYDKRFADFVA